MKTETIPAKSLLAALALAACWTLSGCESRQEQRALYDAWCKLYGRTDITLAEWQALRENYMLPGGDVKRAADMATAAAVSAGVAAGMSASTSAGSAARGR